MKGFLSTADGFVIIFSIADRKSYLAVPRYKEMIEESRDRANEDPVSVVLIGNKTDLEEHRTVSKTEGKILAERFGWQFLEASAAEYEGVDNCFSDLIREIRARRQKMSLCQLPSNMTVNSRRPSWSNCSDTNGDASKRKKWPSLKKRVNYSNLFRKITLCGAWH